MQEIKKIVIIGPESTGKSTLCQLLANHYNTYCCAEFAREYLLKHGMNYTYDDLLTIAQGQVALENEYTNKVKEKFKRKAESVQKCLLFADTDMYVMRVWCEYVFGKCHQYILNAIAERKYDLYLLCNIDLPWVKDELREYPDLKTREELYFIYKEILINQSVPWHIISGSHEERFQMAVKRVDELVT